MDRAAGVSRLGALAVVVGVCAAVATGPAVAWAETPDDSGSSTPGAAEPAEPSDPAGATTPTTTAGLTNSPPTTIERSADEPDERAADLEEVELDAGDAPATPSTKADVKDLADDAPTPVTEDDLEKVAAPRKKSRAAMRTAVSSRHAVGSASQEPSSKPAARVPDLVQSVRTDASATARDALDDVANRSADVLTAVRAVVTAPAVAVLSSTASVAASTATPEAAVVGARQPTVSTVIASVLAVVGFAPRAADGPVVPLQNSPLWGLVAWARKEFDRIFAPNAKTTIAQPGVAAAAVVDPLPGSLDSTPIGWVTGQENTANPGADWPQTNDTLGFNIYGTDLGIMWENGLTGKIQLAFGDTFSGPNMQGDWRSNVLLLSTDTDLSDGLDLVQTGPAFQFIPGAPSALFLNGLISPLSSEVTVIPTSAASVFDEQSGVDEQYVNYMSVKSWDTPGYWTTNYSAMSMYDRSTDKWVLVPSTIRSAGWFRSSTRYVPGSQNFQQAAYVLQPEDQVEEGESRYLYAFGTPAGRQGSAYLSRVAEEDVTDLTKYEYWDGGQWVVNKPAVAAPVIGDSTSDPRLLGFIYDKANDPNFFGGYFGGLVGAKRGGNVSEMSVQYNEYLDKYVVLYADGNNDVQMRLADEPQGPWSAPITIATSAEYPGLYAPMIHPWSGTAKLSQNGSSDLSNLYWNMSIWGNYNVVLMQTDLSSLQTT